jgi:tetrahydromethanopterin S-methyltransferase subunit G
LFAVWLQNAASNFEGCSKMTEQAQIAEKWLPKPDKRESPCAEKTEPLHEQLPKLREQIQPVDLSPITDRLDNIEAELKFLRSEKEEITKKQIEVLGLFALVLKKKAE